MLFVLVEKLNCLLNLLDILQAPNVPLKFVSILLLKIPQRRIWFVARFCVSFLAMASIMMPPPTGRTSESEDGGRGGRLWLCPPRTVGPMQTVSSHAREGYGSTGAVGLRPMMRPTVRSGTMICKQATGPRASGQPL